MVLGTTLRASLRTASDLSHQAISLAPVGFVFALVCAQGCGMPVSALEVRVGDLPVVLYLLWDMASH